MARKPAKKTAAKSAKGAKTAPGRSSRLTRALGRAALSFAIAACLWIAVYSVVPPPTTPYILAEAFRLGGVQRAWVPVGEVPPAVGRAVVAAEDANFCLHWGFDMGALRTAIAEGGSRGASTLSQQVVKNVWLWQGRSWPRKALEGLMTPAVEALWTKRRILEVYLNVAEFGTGVFGVEAAAQHYFHVPAAKLTLHQAALLAAVLPDPKGRSASKPSAFVTRRARDIVQGAETIAADGRAACFEG